MQLDAAQKTDGVGQVKTIVEMAIVLTPATSSSNVMQILPAKQDAGTDPFGKFASFPC